MGNRHGKVKVCPAVPEPDESPLADRGVPSREGRDPSLQDLYDPPVGGGAAPSTLQPDTDTVLGPGARECMTGDAGRRLVGSIGNDGGSPLARKSQASLPDGPGVLLFPRAGRGAVRGFRPPGVFRRGAAPELPLPPPAVPFAHAFQRAPGQAALPLGNTRKPVPAMDVGNRGAKGFGVPPEPSLPVFLILQLHPYHPTFCREPRVAICYNPMSAVRVPKWRNWQTR